jgi:hypothetical protein
MSPESPQSDTHHIKGKQSLVKKSQIIQLLLNLVFGPLGLFYSNWVAGLLFTLIAVGLSAGLFGFGWFLVYPFVIATGFFTVWRFNKRVKIDERRHQEIVEAARQGHGP